MIVKNYTGDVLILKLRQSYYMMRCVKKIATVLVDDDVAVKDSLYTAGRRCSEYRINGKIAGGAAAGHYTR